ncbi:MAG: snare associated Golgi protein-domain-containing protein [Piptocephalis tieghemiana]|nr:MAG: snare associated Golgi protein-domain-containing protein [Piptocephalis tieghemiana]
MPLSLPIHTRSSLDPVRPRPLRSLGAIFAAFLLSAISLYLILELTLDHLKIPTNLGELKRLGKYLEVYSKTYPVSVAIAYCSTFVFVQTFAVPGSLMLSILSGYLFHLKLGLLLTVVCTTLGATCQYLLSYHLAGPSVEYYLGEKMIKWNDQLESERRHLFNYIVFLRATPFLPNWFVNLSSPHLRIPLKTFVFGTMIGIIPPTFVHVQAGTMLLDLKDLSRLATPMNALAIVVVALLAIAPILARKCCGVRDPNVAGPAAPLSPQGEEVAVGMGQEEEEEEGGEEGAGGGAREALLGSLETDRLRRSLRHDEEEGWGEEVGYGTRG